MEILFLLLGISMAMALFGLACFLWANHSGQFLDLERPAAEIVWDESECAGPLHKNDRDHECLSRGGKNIV